MKSLLRSIMVACATFSGAVMIGVSTSSAASDTTLPTGDFPQCSTEVTTFCISAVTFIENGVEKTATWVPSGQATKDAAGVANTTSFSTFGTTETNYSGRWSYDGFPLSRLHDGVYVRAYAPNASVGSDILRIGIEPAGPATTATGQVGRIKDATTGRVGSLDKAMSIKVKVRLGGLIPALNLAASENFSLSRTTENSTTVLTFQGSPTLIPIVSSSAVCKTADGKADALVQQMYVYMLWSNGLTPFGTGGLTGDMTITSNGFCSLSTPSWNSTDKTFDFTASAPHFGPDGSTVTTGFYKAVIPAADAKLLFGLEPADIQKSEVSKSALISASTALEVEITETDGVSKSFTKNIGFDGSKFTVSAVNFTFSSPKIRLKKGAMTPATSGDGATSGPATAPSGNSATSPAATPSAPRLTAVTGGRGSASVSFTAAKGVSYRAVSQLGSKTVTLKCVKAKKGSKITCASRTALKKGTWKITVTPTKDGVEGNKATRSVRVR